MADTQTQSTDASIRTDWQLFINGQYVDSASGETFHVITPATNERLASVARGGRADVATAVAAARDAFDDGKWVRMGAARRASAIYKPSSLMRTRLEEIARLEVLNNGKAISQAKAELTQAIEDFEFFAGAATKITGSTIPVPGQFLNYTVREPI